jgi:hypothetical protein
MGSGVDVSNEEQTCLARPGHNGSTRWDRLQKLLRCPHEVSMHKATSRCFAHCVKYLREP